MTALALGAAAIAYGENDATGDAHRGSLIAAVVGAAGLALALRQRPDAALAHGVLAITAILLVLPWAASRCCGTA